MRSGIIGGRRARELHRLARSETEIAPRREDLNDVELGPPDLAAELEICAARAPRSGYSRLESHCRGGRIGRKKLSSPMVV